MRQPGSLRFFLFLCFFATAVCPPIAAQQPEPPNPELTKRPPPKSAPLPSAVGGVTDGAGTPGTGVDPLNFSLIDNDKPRKILTFRAFNGTTVKPDPPVEVILLIDMANLPFTQVAFVRQQVEDFLHENGG